MADRASNNALYEAALTEPELSIAPRPQKRPFFGLLSRGLAALDQYARDPNNIIAQALPFSDKADRVGITAGFSDLLALPGLTEFTQNLAYGDPLTTGKNQTLKPKDSTVDGVLNALPLVAPIAKGLASATAKFPKPKSNQVNGLLGGLANDDPGLWLSHGSNAKELLSGESLVRELYNPSFAITRDKLSQFKNADSAIVPWPAKLDPKTAKTLLTATDSYNPRWHSGRATRVDNLPWGVDLSKGLADSRVQEFIDQRLFERFGTPYPKQGIKQEGGNIAPKGALPKLGQGLAHADQRFNPVQGSEDWFHQRILASPRFQSLEHFLTSPYGGKLIGDESGHTSLYSVETAAENILDRLYTPEGNSYSRIKLATGKTRPELIKALASNTHPAELLSRQKDPSLSFLDTLFIKDKTSDTGFRALTSAEQEELRKSAAGLLQKVKTAPSDYAELKQYGAFQLSPDNVAGIISREHTSSDAFDRLQKAAKARGIPVEPVRNTREETEAAQWLLSQKKGEFVPLNRGLAGDLTQVVPGPSLHAGDYAASVEAVKAAHKALKANPDNLEALSNFQKAAKNFKLDSDLFVQSGKITNAESGAVAKWLDKELSGFTNPPKTPGLSSSTDFNKKFFQTAGIDTPTEQAMENANWMFKHMSLAKAKNGEWDYISDSYMPMLYQYASGGGHTKLKTLLDDYKHASLAGDGAEHDAALYKLLEEWDQVKPGAPKPASGLSQPDAQAAFSNKTLAELKAMDLVPLFKKFGHKDVLATYDQYLADVAELEKMAAGKTPAAKPVPTGVLNAFK